MPLVLRPPGLRSGLADQLGELGVARKRVAIAAGVFAFVGVALAGVLLTCLLDAALTISPLVRGFALVLTLALAGTVWLRGVAKPSRWRTAPLAVALEIEERFPKLNDSLASAVDFLERAPPGISARFRGAAVRTAEKLAERQDLHRLVPTARMWRAVWFCAAVVAATVPLALWDAERTIVALTRFADPFGQHPWPPKTHIDLLSPRAFPHRMPKGEEFILRFVVRGEVPNHAEVTFRIEGGHEFTRIYPLVLETDPNESQPVDSGLPEQPPRKRREPRAIVTARLDPADISRSFQFRIRADDADTGWQSVTVVVPPRLVPLGGRASPLLHIDPPAYTGLRSIDLPDGSAVIEIPTGTRVTLLAATDTRLASAVLSYTGDASLVERATPFTHLGLPNPLQAFGSNLVAESIAREVPATLGDEGRTLELSFTPCFSGMYALKLTDDTGMSGVRLLEVRIVADPAPSLTLVRPAVGKDSPVLIPTAHFMVQVAVDDKIYAFRRVFLEYRVGTNGTVRRMPLCDIRQVGTWLPAVGGGTVLSQRPQPTHFEGNFELAVSDFWREDGTPLRAGDHLTLWAAADDWDDVTVLKEPGRSEQVSIAIVSKEGAEAYLLEQLGPLRREIARARNQQRDALDRVNEMRARPDGGRTGADRDTLLTVEQIQRQVRGKITDTNDGLRARADLLRESVRANDLTGTPTAERIDAVASGLGRLAERDLATIEPLLSTARQRGQQPNNDEALPLLAKAAEHQQEVDDALSALLDVLSAWGGAGEIRGEARMLRDAILREVTTTELLPMQVPAGLPPQALDPEQRATLDRTTARLEQLVERANALIARAAKLADEKDQAALEARSQASGKSAEAAALRARASALPADSPERRDLEAGANSLTNEASGLRSLADRAATEAAALRKALTDADVDPADVETRRLALAAATGWPATVTQPQQLTSGQLLVNELRDARRELERNRTGRAVPLERSAATRLERLAAALEEKEAETLPGQEQKWKNAADQLDALAGAEFDLNKRIAAANQIADPAARAEALKTLAAEQKKLLDAAKDLALRLTRERSDAAARDARDAIDKMQAAKDDLEAGKDPARAPREAVDKLDEARDKLDNKSANANKEQTDEKRKHLADRIKAILTQQKALIAEAQQMQKRAMEEKGWDRVALGKFSALQEQEEFLALEVGTLATEFAEYPVFHRLLLDAAGALDLAGKRVQARKREIIDADPDLAFDANREKRADERVHRPMSLAVRRLEQVLAGLEDAPGKDTAKKADAKNTQPNAAPNPQSKPPGSDHEIVPPLAQLKALRALQAELNERTLAFNKAHPDRARLTEDEKTELKEIEDSQRELAVLFQHVAKLFEKEPPAAKEKP